MGMILSMQIFYDRMFFVTDSIRCRNADLSAMETRFNSSSIFRYSYSKSFGDVSIFFKITLAESLERFHLTVKNSLYRIYREFKIC